MIAPTEKKNEAVMISKAFEMPFMASLLMPFRGILYCVYVFVIGQMHDL